MELTKLREQIDRLDSELLQAIATRMEYVVRIRRLKEKVTDPGREDLVLQRARRCAHGLLSEKFSEEFMKTIIAESKRLQELPLKLYAFRGIHGSWGDAAALQYDSTGAGIAQQKLSEVFEAVESGTVDYGVVPIEGALEDSEHEVQLLLIQSKLHIIGEVMLPVKHSLLVLPDSNHREIRDVYSSISALSHCQAFLKRNKLTGHPVVDSAAAARKLSRERLSGSAAIASEECAKLYCLEVLKEDVDDIAGNKARYIIISKNPSAKPGDRCSVTFEVAHQSGSLQKVLGLFSEAQINLTLIQSIRSPEPTRPVTFLLDFQASETDDRVQKIFEKIKGYTANFRLLGCY